MKHITNGLNGILHRCHFEKTGEDEQGCTWINGQQVIRLRNNRLTYHEGLDEMYTARVTSTWDWALTATNLFLHGAIPILDLAGIRLVKSMFEKVAAMARKSALTMLTPKHEVVELDTPKAA